MQIYMMIMGSLLSLNDEELDIVVRYSLDNDESMAEAVVNAFLAANVNVFDKPTQLADWVDVDVLDKIQGASDQPLYLWTRIWDHIVVISPEEVRIYSRKDLV